MKTWSDIEKTERERLVKWLRDEANINRAFGEFEEGRHCEMSADEAYAECDRLRAMAAFLENPPPRAENVERVLEQLSLAAKEIMDELGEGETARAVFELKLALDNLRYAVREGIR